MRDSHRKFSGFSTLILALSLFWLLSGDVLTAPHTPQPPDGTQRRLRVPILMYHYVSTPPPGADDIRLNLSISPALFRQHLEYLRSQGYQSVSLYEVHSALTTGAPLPDKPIVLTFDDGHIDHYTTVFPLLQEYGFTATFFIITATADNRNPEHLSWDQIIEMADAGMSMEPHSKTHPDLTQRNRDFLVYQILGSIESLEAHTGRPARVFAYPIGRYDDLTLSVAAEVGVIAAVTTEMGAVHTTSGLLEMPRLRITREMGVAGLSAMLRSY